MLYNIRVFPQMRTVDNERVQATIKLVRLCYLICCELLV